MMASESPSSLPSLYEQLTELSELSDALVDSKLPADQTAKECWALIGKLEDLNALVDELIFCDGKEQLDNIATENLRMLKITAYLGFLLTNKGLENRMECIEKAIFYLKQYLNTLKKLNVFDDPDLEQLLLDDSSKRAHRQMGADGLLQALHERERRAERSKSHSKLKCYFIRLKAGPHFVHTEKQLRELYLDELRLYGFRAFEELAVAREHHVLLQIKQAVDEEQRLLDERLETTMFDSLSTASEDSEEFSEPLTPAEEPNEPANELTTLENQPSTAVTGSDSDTRTWKNITFQLL